MSMRRGALLLLLLTGCVSLESSRQETAKSVAWQTQKVDAAPGSDRVLFDVALLQRPLGDPFLTDEIWASADEMIVPPDQRELLELNGLRVGLLVGSPPDKLLNVLKSERDCIERRGRSTPGDSTIDQKLFEHEDVVGAVVHIGKTSETVLLDRPRFLFDLTPTLKPNDVVRLKLTPRYEAGDKAFDFRPVPEESKWAMEMKRPTKILNDLAIAIDLAPDQLLIVGPRLERGQSIGYHSFVGDRDVAICQRLMILRHVRSKTPVATVDNTDYGVSPPLAAQAATTRRP